MSWLHWVAAALFILVFAPTMVWLWGRWTMSIWHNAHGALVPLLVGYFAYRELRRDTSEVAESSQLGFLFLLTGLLLLAIDSVIGTQLLAAIGMLVCLPGLSLLFLGWRRTRNLAFPLLLAFFMLPVPAAAIEPLHLALRHISAAATEVVVEMLGIPVLRESTTLSFSGGSVAIADACSGFSAIYAAVTMSFVLAYWMLPGVRRWVPLIAAVPLAIFFNILRCTALVLLVDQVGPWTLDTPLHVISGLASFTLTMLALLMLSNQRSAS